MLLGSSDLNTDADCQPSIAAAAPTADRPWVEIRNTCSTPQSLDTTVLRWAGDDFGWGATALSGALAPGECTLVTDFDQPLIEGECGAAFALFSVFDDALTTSPWSEVWYGDVECSTDVERPTNAEHIELQGDAWVLVQGTAPTCAKAPPTVPPVIIPAPLCAPLDEQGKVYCEAHPWGRAPGCKEEQSAGRACRRRRPRLGRPRRTRRGGPTDAPRTTRSDVLAESDARRRIEPILDTRVGFAGRCLAGVEVGGADLGDRLAGAALAFAATTRRSATRTSSRPRSSSRSRPARAPSRASGKRAWPTSPRSTNARSSSRRVVLALKSARCNGHRRASTASR